MNRKPYRTLREVEKWEARQFRETADCHAPGSLRSDCPLAASCGATWLFGGR